MTKVSVIIAAHNAGALIHHAIESALTQTHANLEVLVTDDGSADDTSAIVQTYATADPRVILLRHEHSLGPS